MEQAHAKALAALQPFLHLAITTKSPSHRFLADLITRATSAPGTYVFTELLQLPSIQTLRTADTPAESQAYLTVLEIFSWGTYEEYKTTPNLPPLNDVQTLKLRQLSLLSIASPFLPTTLSTNTLTYASLLSALSLPDFPSLETLIRTSIYASLLTARLAPTSDPPTVHITSIAPLRDLRPQSLPALLQILSTWQARCNTAVESLQSQITTIRTTSQSRHTLQSKRQDVVDGAVLGLFTTGSEPTGTGTGKGKGQRKRDLDLDENDVADGGSEEDGHMDVDENAGDVGLAGTGVGGHGAAASSSSRGTKRNRGRG